MAYKKARNETLLASLQHALESLFAVTTVIDKPSVSVFSPKKPATVGTILGPLLNSRRIDPRQRAALIETLETDGLLDCLTELLEKSPQRVLHLFESRSRVSGDWSLWSFTLGSRGYLFFEDDYGAGADESLPLLYAWTPPRRDAFRRFFVEVYPVVAREYGFPPYAGDEVLGGNINLLVDALIALGDWDAVQESLQGLDRFLDPLLPAEVAEAANVPFEGAIEALRIIERCMDRQESWKLADQMSKAGRRIQRAVAAAYCSHLKPT